MTVRTHSRAIATRDGSAGSRWPAAITTTAAAATAAAGFWFGGPMGFGGPGGPCGGRGRGARAPRRRPRRAAHPARRGAAQRLPADAGDRAPQRGRLAPEPRLGLPGAPAARGRGPGALRGDRRPQAVPPHRRGPRGRRGGRRRGRAVGRGQRRPSTPTSGSCSTSPARSAWRSSRSPRPARAEQLAAAREVLTNARRALYGILAEDETTEDLPRRPEPGVRPPLGAPRRGQTPPAAG